MQQYDQQLIQLGSIPQGNVRTERSYTIRTTVLSVERWLDRSTKYSPLQKPHIIRTPPPPQPDHTDRPGRTANIRNDEPGNLKHQYRHQATAFNGLVEKEDNTQWNILNRMQRQILNTVSGLYLFQTIERARENDEAGK